ncbi:MAG: 5'-deoxynucleotidase [Lachnospiraceae bacterium]|nr:5'-deoxynucleotidase [Lachnospiraceae bacterium]
MEEKIYSFGAMMSRMKYIDRWALMRNSTKENISEHSLEVAMLAHLLAVIGKVRFGRELDSNKAALLGIYHDTTEIITGDMPTPIKYYSVEMRDTFKEIEDLAAVQLLDMLPEDIRKEYEDLFFAREKDEYIWKLVKAADKISALIKCVEEEKTGNTEFVNAKKLTRKAIDDMGLEEVDVFFKDFFPAYLMTLDELQGNAG